MKPMFVSTVLLASAIGILGQGSVNFNNRATSGSPAPVVAPIFGVDPIEPLAPRFGNPATYAVAPVPAGTQTYGGAPLVGTGWTAELWAANAQLLDDQMVPISQTTFRVTTNPSLMGFVQPPALAPIVPGVAPGTSDRAKFELR